MTSDTDDKQADKKDASLADNLGKFSRRRGMAGIPLPYLAAIGLGLLSLQVIFLISHFMGIDFMPWDTALREGKGL